MSGNTNTGTYHFPSTSIGNTPNLGSSSLRQSRWRTTSTTNASWDSTSPFSTMNQYDYQNNQPTYFDEEDEQSRSSSLRRLRRISGMFEQTAMDVQEGARNVMSTVIVPATNSSREYAREKPFKATFLALLTFLSFVPVLLFMVFAIAVVIFAAFTSLSFVISSATLAFILGAVLLAATLLLCVAPISLIVTAGTFVFVWAYRLSQICFNYMKSKLERVN
ncbi:hypothetical protein FRC20_007738 [Serendipita sp. 405]|nr:hypothetical protein FRC20_007738 [Serendipita sp. 405]